MSAALSLNNTSGERLVPGTANLKLARKRPAILGLRGKFVKMKDFAHVQPSVISAQLCRTATVNQAAPDPGGSGHGRVHYPGLGPARDYGKSHFAA